MAVGKRELFHKPKGEFAADVVELPSWAQSFVKFVDAFKHKIGRNDALSAIRRARSAESDSVVMIKPRPNGVRIDG